MAYEILTLPEKLKKLENALARNLKDAIILAPAYPESKDMLEEIAKEVEIISESIVEIKAQIAAIQIPKAK